MGAGGVLRYTMRVSPLKKLQTWMGHSDVQMITEIYSKLTKEQEAPDAIKLTAYMSQSAEKSRDSGISA